MSRLDRLPPVSRDRTLNVIVETPQGSRNKYDWDPELKLFAFGKPLPAGASFPFDFGFIPSTVGGDGDPLDVLVLMDSAAFSGCLVRCRLLGVIEARQTEPDGTVEQNDRLIAVAKQTKDHAGITTLEDLGGSVLDQIEHFFSSYNAYDGKSFEVLARSGPDRALEIVREAASRRRSTSKSNDGGRRAAAAGLKSKVPAGAKSKSKTRRR